jgi:hypothetical protein
MVKMNFLQRQAIDSLIQQETDRLGVEAAVTCTPIANHNDSIVCRNTHTHDTDFHSQLLVKYLLITNTGETLYLNSNVKTLHNDLYTLIINDIYEE